MPPWSFYVFNIGEGAIMSFFERFKANAEDIFNKRAADAPPNESDTEEKFIKNISMNKTEFPDDVKSLMHLKPLIYKDFKEHQSGRYADKDSSRAREAYVKIYVTEDKMTAFLCAFPPANNGKEITVDVMLEDLSLEGVTYGIDHELIAQIADKRQYLCMYAVARGTLPADGKNGEIIDFFIRNEKMDIQIEKDKNIDFDKPILFHRIKKGEAICRIVPPDQGCDGSNIFGRRSSGRGGVSVAVPQGNHTVLSKDKTVLLAEIDGDIFFENGVFSIENRLVIEGDLTDSSNILDFAGDIIISGDVGNQVEIHAGGGVIIGGQVGSAVIHAGKYIYISKGMGGEAQGVLNAHGDVMCKLMENVKVVIQGDLYANVVNRCDITADGSVYINGGKGMLIGGTTRITGFLEAKRIGNQSFCVNSISIGYNPRLNAYLKDIDEKISKIEITLEKIKKAKQQSSNSPNLSQERKDIFLQMNQQEKLYLEEKNKLGQERIQYLLTCKEDEKSFVKAESIQPITIVTFRNKKLSISKENDNCKVFYTGTELRQIKF